MRQALLSLLIFATLIGAEKYPGFIWPYKFSIGDNKEDVIDAAFQESGVFYYDNMLYMIRFQITPEPIGIISSQYRIIFDTDTVAYVERQLNGWVDIYKTELPERKASADSKTREAWNEIAATYKTKTISKSDSSELLELSNDNHSIRAKLLHTETFAGIFRIFNDSAFADYPTPNPEKQWFGIGDVTADSIIKTKETNALPLSEDIRYVWAIETDFAQETEVFITAQFPAPLEKGQIPPGTSYDPLHNRLTMPMGTCKEMFVSTLGMDKHDPQGTYRMTLFTKEKVIAAVSYSIEVPKEK